jgi:hypothetical protein
MLLLLLLLTPKAVVLGSVGLLARQVEHLFCLKG